MRIAVFVLAGILALGVAAWAGEGGDVPLVDNGGFEVDGAPSGAGWEATQGVIFGPLDVRPSTAYDPWPFPGASNYIRQVIDNTKSPGWNPLLNHKIETLSFDLYTLGNGYVQIGFDWWDRNDRPKPFSGEPADHWEVLPTPYVSLNHWTTYTVTYDWVNKQPRWTSFEIYYYGIASAGDIAGVDDVVLTSICVPEPSSLLAFASGTIGLLGFAWRRRH